MKLTSQHVKKLKSGIIEWIINTDKRWMPYRETYSLTNEGTRFIITFYNKDESEELLKVENKDINEIETDDCFRYVKLNNQEKNQLIIYFIPYQMLKE